MATVTPTWIAGKWLLYRNNELGFSFEYPALFEEPEIRNVCGAREADNSVVIADQIIVSSEPSRDRTPDQLVDELIARDELRVETRISKGAINYRFGSMNAFGSLYVVEAHGRLYVIRFEAGTLACEFPEQAIGRFEALQHLSETISMFEPVP